MLALEAINARDRRRDGARAGRSGQQGTGADVARRGDLEAAREARRVARVDPEVRRAAAEGDDPVARRAPRLLAGALRRPRGPAARSDSAPQARDRARSRPSPWRMRCCRRCTPTPASRRWRRRSAQKAFELRDRVSERERFFISWRYYRDADPGLGQGARAGAIVDGHLSERGVRLQQPRQSRSSASASSSSRSNRFAKRSGSIRSSSRRTRISPRRCWRSTGSTRRGRSCSEAADRELDFIGARRLSYLLAFVQGDTETMARELEASVGVGETNAGVRLAGAHVGCRTARAGGARASSAAASRCRCRETSSEVAAQLTMEDAETHATVGQCAEARQRGLRGARVEPRQRDARARQPRLASVRRAQRGVELSSELAKRFPEATLTTQRGVPVIAAAAGASTGRPGACARTARAGQAVRSRAVRGVLAGLPSRPGVPAAEGRPGGRGRVPEDPGPSRRSAGVDAVSARASRARASQA